MPKELIEEIVVEVEPLPASEPIGSATRKVIASGLPALPAVDEDGSSPASSASASSWPPSSPAT